MKNINCIFILLLLFFMLNLFWLSVKFNALLDIIMFVIFLNFHDTTSFKILV